MSLIPKFNISSHWKTFSAEIKRRWNIIFEHRDIEEIRKDYYLEKWISKTELEKLFEYEKIELIVSVKHKDEEIKLMLENFHQNALTNYEMLERKYQGSLKK